MQMGSNLDKTNDWFISSSPSPEIHIFLPPDVLSSVSALPEQILKFVLNHLHENYPLFECSCTFTSENSLKIIINNAHILGAKIEEHDGIIEFPEMREEIRSDLINILREIKSSSNVVNTIEVTNEDKELIKQMRIASDERLDLDTKVANLNKSCSTVFKDGEVFSLNANGRTMDYIYIYNPRWEPIIKFSTKASTTFIMNATRIIFNCKEIGFKYGIKNVDPNNIMKDAYGFAIQQQLDNSFFLSNSILRNEIVEASTLLKELEPKEFLVGNSDAVIINAFKDGFAVGSYLQTQSLIDHEKYGITPKYF